MYTELPSLEIIMDHVTFVVKNTYLCNSQENIRQQTIGIPMGTNAAPELANLTLYVDEARYIDNLIATGNIEKAERHAHTFRYIDDIITWDEEPPPEEIYQLGYSEQFLPDGSVSFLGGKIATKSNGYIVTSIFDKTSEWNFPIVRYTHANSNIPSHITRGIFQGQLQRYRNICNCYKTFKMATSKLTVILLERNHYAGDLLKAWKCHVRKYSRDKGTNYNSFNKWFKKLMVWATHESIRNRRKMETGNAEPNVTEVINGGNALNGSDEIIGQTDNNLVDNDLVHDFIQTVIMGDNNVIGQINDDGHGYNIDDHALTQTTVNTIDSLSQHSVDGVEEEKEGDTRRLYDILNPLYETHILVEGFNIEKLVNEYYGDPEFSDIHKYLTSFRRKVEIRQHGHIHIGTSVCNICSQTMGRGGTHRKQAHQLLGCVNIARLRHYIMETKHLGDSGLPPPLRLTTSFTTYITNT